MPSTPSRPTFPAERPTSRSHPGRSRTRFSREAWPELYGDEDHADGMEAVELLRKRGVTKPTVKQILRAKDELRRRGKI